MNACKRELVHNETQLFPTTTTTPSFRSPTLVPSHTIIYIFSIQEITHLLVKLLIVMVIIILITNHVVDASLNGVLVESHVLTNLIELVCSIRVKAVKIVVLGSHMFMYQFEALLLSSFKCVTPTKILFVALLLLNTHFFPAR